MKHFILDTETTGIGHTNGHRIIEIGIVLLENLTKVTDRFHVYINPQRAVDPGAFKVHGISDKFLHDKPLFSEISNDLVAFLDDKTVPIVAHNASFDIGFLDAELGRLGLPPIDSDRVIDSLKVARKAFPGANNNLNALCRRFNVDLSGRQLHGALLDAELLAKVYVELLGGKQGRLALEQAERQRTTSAIPTEENKSKGIIIKPSPVEQAAHREFIEAIADKAS